MYLHDLKQLATGDFFGNSKVDIDFQEFQSPMKSVFPKSCILGSAPPNFLDLKSSSPLHSGGGTLCNHFTRSPALINTSHKNPYQ